jgi:hypothetical protein
MSHRHPWIASTLAALAAAGAATAADPPARTSPPAATEPAGLVAFAAVDRNRDGAISALEAEAFADLQAQFETLDANRDGQLAPLEFERWSRAAKAGKPVDPTTAPGGSSGAQHMPPVR